MRSLATAQAEPVAMQAGMSVHLSACFLARVAVWPEGHKIKADMAPLLEGLMAEEQQDRVPGVLREVLDQMGWGPEKLQRMGC